MDYDFPIIFPIILGMSSSKLTKSIIFQRGRWLNHQPDWVGGPLVNAAMF